MNTTLDSPTGPLSSSSSPSPPPSYAGPITFKDIENVQLSFEDAQAIVEQIQYYFEDKVLDNPKDLLRQHILSSPFGFVPFSLLAHFNKLRPFVQHHPYTLIKAFYMYPSNTLTVSPDNLRIGRMKPYVTNNKTVTNESISFITEARVLNIVKSYFTKDMMLRPNDEVGRILKEEGRITIDKVLQYPRMVKAIGKDRALFIAILRKYSTMHGTSTNTSSTSISSSSTVTLPFICPVTISDDEIYLLPLVPTVPTVSKPILTPNPPDPNKKIKQPLHTKTDDDQSEGMNKLDTVIDLLRNVCDIGYIAYDKVLQASFLTRDNASAAYRYRAPSSSSSSSSSSNTNDDSDQTTSPLLNPLIHTNMGSPVSKNHVMVPSLYPFSSSSNDNAEVVPLPELVQFFTHITSRYNDYNSGIQFLPFLYCLSNLSLLDLTKLIPDIVTYFDDHHNTITTPSGTHLHLLKETVPLPSLSSSSSIDPSSATGSILKPLYRYRLWLENVSMDPTHGIPCLREMMTETGLTSAMNNPTNMNFGSPITNSPVVMPPSSPPSPSSGISMMSFNVLGPNTTDQEYYYTDPHHLPWKYRRAKIIQEIAYYRPTVIAMQELTTTVCNLTGWDTPLPKDPACWMRKVMLSLGYDGIYLTHGQDPVSGEIAAKYRQDLQEALDQQNTQLLYTKPVLPLNETFPPPGHSGDWEYTVNSSRSNYHHVHKQIKHFLEKTKQDPSAKVPLIEGYETLGIALFWRIDKVEPLLTQRIPYSAIFLERLGYSIESTSIELCYNLIARNKGCLLAALRLRNETDPQRIFIAGSSHISCAFTEPWYQMMESQAYAFALHRLATKMNPLEPGKVPFMIAGDFNATPDSTVYRFLTTGKTDLKDWIPTTLHTTSEDSNTKTTTNDATDIIHHLPFGVSLPSYRRFVSAYRTVLHGTEPRYTNFVYRKVESHEAKLYNPALTHHNLPLRMIQLPASSNKSTTNLTNPHGKKITVPHRPFVETLDYLFYNPSNLVPRSVLLPPSIETMAYQGTAGACPNHRFPSDHVSILGIFDFV